MGVHILAKIEDVRAFCAAVQMCEAVAVAIEEPARQEPSSIKPAQEMPPTDERQLKQYLRRLEGGGAAKSASSAEPVYISSIVMCWSPDRAFCIPFRAPEVSRRPTSCPPVLQCWPFVAEALSSPVMKVAIGVRHIARTLRRLSCRDDSAAKLRAWLPVGGLGIDIGGVLADVRVSASLLDMGHKFTSDAEVKETAKSKLVVQGPAEQLLNQVHMLSGSRLSDAAGRALQPPPDAALELAPEQDPRLEPSKLATKLAVAREAQFSMALHQQLQPALAATEACTALERIERPYTRMLEKLEWRGLPVDAGALEAQLGPVSRVQTELSKSWKAVAKANGITHPNDPEPANHQVKVLVWDKLALPKPLGTEVR
jgi:hypothetical protein